MRRLDRRRFIRLGAATFGAGAALAACARRSDSGRSDASDSETRDERVMLTALLMRLFPHDDLEPVVYEETAEIIHAKLTAQPEWSKAYHAGLDALDKSAGGDWLSENADAQTDHLAAAGDRPFFKMLYGVALAEFYSNPKVWAHLGYEGPSAEYGGYVNRGFDDIDWLPEAGR